MRERGDWGEEGGTIGLWRAAPQPQECTLRDKSLVRGTDRTRGQESSRENPTRILVPSGLLFLWACVSCDNDLSTEEVQELLLRQHGQREDTLRGGLLPRDAEGYRRQERYQYGSNWWTKKSSITTVIMANFLTLCWKPNFSVLPESVSL